MIDDGGPAFPYESRQLGTGVLPLGAHPGISLRDWFAGQALATIKTDEWKNEVAIGRWCYAMADAMIAARKESGK